MNIPVNPSFTIIINVGCKRVYITRTCYHDDVRPYNDTWLSSRERSEIRSGFGLVLFDA